MKTKIVKVFYRFKISYGHIDHIKPIIEKLKEAPIHSEWGCDKNGMYYGCERVGVGKIVEKGVVVT